MHLDNSQQLPDTSQKMRRITDKPTTRGGLTERLSNEVTKKHSQNQVRRIRRHEDIMPLVKEVVNLLPPGSNAYRKMSDLATAMRTNTGEDEAWRDLTDAAVTNSILASSLTKIEDMIKQKTLQARVNRLVLDNEGSSTFVESTLDQLPQGTNAHTKMSELATAIHTNTGEDEAWRNLIHAAENDPALKTSLDELEQRIRLQTQIGRIRLHEDIRPFVQRALDSLPPDSNAHVIMSELATAIHTNTGEYEAWRNLKDQVMTDPALKTSLKQIAQDIKQSTLLQAQVKRIRHHKDIKSFVTMALRSLSRGTDAHTKMSELATAMHTYQGLPQAWHTLTDAAMTDPALKTSLDQIEQKVQQSTLLQAQVNRIRHHKDIKLLVTRASRSLSRDTDAHTKMSKLATAMRINTGEDEAWHTLTDAAVTDPVLKTSLDQIERKIRLQAQVKRIRHHKDIKSFVTMALQSLPRGTDAHTKMSELATAMHTYQGLPQAWRALTDAAVTDPALETSLDQIEHDLDWGGHY